jgi:iron complex transport system ATP-binding protein
MMLQASGIEVRIDDKTILRGIDAAVAAGELIGLIGPNGAGKTTLLRVLANLMPPTNGIVRCDGRAFRDYSSGDFAKRVAYLAQGHAAHWPMTVEKLVQLGRLPHRRGWRGPHPDDGRIVAAAMAATDVVHLRDRTIGTLSGGERVRVMLARAFAVEAPTLLVDEPVAALDPYHQLQVMEVLRETAHRGTAVVAVLHDLTLAARFCDRLLLLREGRVLVEGNPSDVLTGPHLEQAFRVTTLRGQHDGQDYVVPWSRYLSGEPDGSGR